MPQQSTESYQFHVLSYLGSELCKLLLLLQLHPPGIYPARLIPKQIQPLQKYNPAPPSKLQQVRNRTHPPPEAVTIHLSHTRVFLAPRAQDELNVRKFKNHTMQTW